MAYVKGHPIRVNMGRENYDLLIKALKTNENEFEGFVSETARKLREKIEKHTKTSVEDGGEEIYSIGFYEKEGEQFIWQFIAAATIISLHEEIEVKSEQLMSLYGEILQLTSDDEDELPVENSQNE